MNDKRLFQKELVDTIDLLKSIMIRTEGVSSWGTNRCGSQIRGLNFAKKKIEAALEIVKSVRKGL